MSKLEWLKDLVRAEQQMEEAGVVDFTAGFDAAQTLRDETLLFLDTLKTEFVESATAFNQMKGTGYGGVKIFGIANTLADFMLFRNGFKLIFTMKEPGLVAVRHDHPTGFLPGTPTADFGSNEDLLEARWGAFGELVWTYRQMNVKTDYLVRYYLTKFIRESAK